MKFNATEARTCKINFKFYFFFLLLSNPIFITLYPFPHFFLFRHLPPSSPPKENYSTSKIFDVKFKIYYLNYVTFGWIVYVEKTLLDLETMVVAVAVGGSFRKKNLFVKYPWKFFQPWNPNFMRKGEREKQWIHQLAWPTKWYPFVTTKKKRERENITIKRKRGEREGNGKETLREWRKQKTTIRPFPPLHNKIIIKYSLF